MSRLWLACVAALIWACTAIQHVPSCANARHNRPCRHYCCCCCCCCCFLSCGSRRRAAYAAWQTAYADVSGPLLARSLAAWNSIKAWLAVHSPQILDTLNPGATAEQLADAEEQLGHPLPAALRCIYRYSSFSAPLALLALQKQLLLVCHMTISRHKSGRRQTSDMLKIVCHLLPS